MPRPEMSRSSSNEGQSSCLWPVSEAATNRGKFVENIKASFNVNDYIDGRYIVDIMDINLHVVSISLNCLPTIYQLCINFCQLTE